MKARHYILPSVAVGVLLFIMITPSEAPTTLSESRKQDVVSRLHTEILVGQLLYDLPTVFPPAVSFDLDNGNAAESVCTHEALAAGEPRWKLRVNERMAAQNWRQFVDETLPHEAAHLVLCQVRPDWTEHDDRWRSVVRELGAEPREYHRYERSTD